MTEYRIAARVKEYRNSIIREVAEKGRMVPNFCTFALGNPAVEGIPIEELQSCVTESVLNAPLSAFKYGPIEGDDALKKWIANRLVGVKGFPVRDNRIMLVAGSGKSLGYLPRVMCDPGDEVFFDHFSYPNAYYSVRNIGAVAVPIPMDEFGMIPDALEQHARRGKGKYIYLIPNFHNPTGMTMPLQRRKDLYEIARKYDLVIYEDDPYGEIRFAGEDIPAIKTFDEDNRVVYAGSFSKTLSAGLRVGYTYANEKLDQKLKMVRGGDGQDAVFPQIVIRKYLERYNYDQHLDDIRKIYQKKCHMMLDLLDQYMPEPYRITRPEGGMFIWVTVPEYVDIAELSDVCIAAGVGIVQSKAFSVDPDDPGHAFRLNFSSPPESDMERGIETLGRIAKHYCR